MVFGIALAFLGGTLYALGIAVQAREAREVSHDHTLKFALIGKLLKNTRWVGGTLIGLLGWACEAAALLLAPLSVVQPSLAFGLVVLLVIGERMLGERFGAREAIGVSCILVGVAGIALIAPERDVNHASAAAIATVIVGLAAISLLPRALRSGSGKPPPTLIAIGAGCAFACAALISKLVADGISSGSFALVVVLLVPAIIASLLAVTNEMSALQLKPANQVTPMIFCLEMLIPVLAAPFLVGEAWRSPMLMAALVGVVVAGTIVVGSSRAVASMVETTVE